jgi:hypothetical protein
VVAQFGVVLKGHRLSACGIMRLGGFCFRAWLVARPQRRVFVAGVTLARPKQANKTIVRLQPLREICSDPKIKADFFSKLFSRAANAGNSERGLSPGDLNFSN